VDVGAGYLGSILVPLIVLGLGFGFTLGPAINAATARVAPDDAVVASGMANTMQPTGGSIGIALLSTLAAGASTSYLSSHPSHVPAGPCGGRGARLPAAYLISCGIFLAVPFSPPPCSPAGQPLIPAQHPADSHPADAA